MAQSRRARGGALDAIDRQIIAALHRDGRAQSTAIGEELGLSGNLVATRIRAMDAAGTMRVVAVADFRVHGYRMLARIRVKPNGRAPLDIANELARREDVLSVHLTSGAYPVSCLYAFVNARDLIEAARAVSADIAGVEDVDVELLNSVYRYRPAIGPIAEPGAIGPIAEPGAIGPIAEPGA
ncbi:Lrp/AsnC family transcriptional regulator [Novosphingobium sp.]|uniref:Lrp/AsnC family transcriptional regulator n=1 Tax=Novosphingobium sp. TaxID=1874826 RepID=UPI003B529327